MPGEAREQAVGRLAGRGGDALPPNPLDRIFAVGIFNEGIGIPEVNQVVMLRPIESPIALVQQPGCDLRKANGGECVVVLDCIGNFASNYLFLQEELCAFCGGRPLPSPHAARAKADVVSIST